MGCYYLTISKEEMKGHEIIFSSATEVHTALGANKVHGHASIKVRLPADKVVHCPHGKVQQPDEHGFYVTLLAASSSTICSGIPTCRSTTSPSPRRI